MSNYMDLSVTELHDLLKSKKIKPIDLVNEALEKIENYKLNDFITINEKARKEALELENTEVDNLFWGIPIAIKDNIVTKDLRTTCASKMLDDFNPIYDAEVIKKIKEKHMIIIGKTNMDEFAMGSTGETSYYGPTLNPWNKKKVPGGSSSGSAATISSREVALALGSDTGGSIRQPASFQGVVGMKPTYGRVSRNGLVAFASSLDQIGPITKNVLDNALLLELISGYDENDMTSIDASKDFTSLINKPLKSYKIAVPTFYMNDQINEEIKDKVNNVISLLRENGCTVDFVDVPYLEYSVPLYQVIALGEASSNLARFDGIKYGLNIPANTTSESIKKTRTAGFGEEVKRRIMIGTYVLSGKNADKYYVKALKLREALREAVNKVFENYDLIIGPTNTGVAYDLGIKQDDALKSFTDDILTNPINMTGLPALSLPIGLTNDRLPVGLHIIGKYLDEKNIYALAAFIEKELDLKLKPEVK
ncbi:MAG: Asp-tRNA(Asn)/Glu-tRNA(Gln) amidotransferase subunit GatA [Firmicutes bacterium]|jgi:aspartyl-tRNA(Asn)/glutamyl-tRNA(Gln) amidotransferase subunit A|nr:Asp-tRNA(Asn)/Glu-tRNA(Gln) amidotransferase subunit GatA [Bacillota bacterium]